MSFCTFKTTEHFLEILKGGATKVTGNAIDSQSSQACLSGICRLCSPNQLDNKHKLAIASLGLPIFINVTSQILTRFLRDDVSGVHMKKFRIDEVKNALTLMKNLYIPNR
eukprot:UN17380